MMRYIRIGTAFFCILLLGGLFGCTHSAQPTTEPKKPMIAVVDWEAVLQAHPLAKQWRQKQADRLTAQRVLAFQDDLLQRQRWFDDRLTSSRLQYSDAVLQTKMAELTAKKREMLLVWEKDAKEALETAWRRASDEIEDKYRAELTNLQLKLAVLTLPKEDKKQLETAHAQVLQQRDRELRDKRRDLETQLVKRRAAEEARVSVQLAAESDRVMRDFAQSAGSQAPLQGMAGQTEHEALAGNRKSLLAQIDRLQKEEATLAESMENDIRAEAERLGSERRFDVVLRKVVVNVTAVDVTQDLIKALQLRAKTQNTINESGERKQ